MKHIHRVDCPKKHMHGWYVRIHQLDHAKLFSDSKHGGKDGALTVATTHRDRMLAHAGIPLSERTVITRSPRNTTGIIGVHLYQRDGRSYYVVSYPVERARSKRKMFRIGEGEEARKATLKVAAAFRMEQEKKIYGATINANWRWSFAEVCQ